MNIITILRNKFKRKMSLENSLKDCITRELQDGVIEKVIAEKLEECIGESIDSLFKWDGCIKRTIRIKLEDTIVPFLETYDYSQSVAKVDDVLTEVLKLTALDNKKMLENFKDLMSTEDVPDEISILKILDVWCDYVVENIDHDKIEGFDSEGGYINIKFNTEEVSSSWADYETRMVTFECDDDEDFNVEFMLTRWKKYDKEYYRLEWKRSADLDSLRHLNKFEVYMMRLNQAYVKVNLDKEYISDELFIENKGE